LEILEVVVVPLVPDRAGGYLASELVQWLPWFYVHSRGSVLSLHRELHHAGDAGPAWNAQIGHGLKELATLPVNVAIPRAPTQVDTLGNTGELLGAWQLYTHVQQP
jgi:hypothetical protein